MIAYRTTRPPLCIPTAGITLGVVGVREEPRMVINPAVHAIRRIQYAVADHYGVRWFDFMSDRRDLATAHPRQVAMYLCRELTRHSLPRIAERFRRDHTTVLHAVRAVKRRMLADNQLAIDIDMLIAQLNPPVDNGENSAIMSKSLTACGKEQSMNGQEEMAA